MSSSSIQRKSSQWDKSDSVVRAKKTEKGSLYMAIFFLWKKERIMILKSREITKKTKLEAAASSRAEESAT